MKKHQTRSNGRWEIFHRQKNDFDAVDEVAAKYHFQIDTSVNPEKTRQQIIEKIKWA